MVHAISLYAALLGVWLLLSGIFTPFFLALAAVCCGLVVFIAQRMDLIDRDTAPVRVSWRFLPYLPWLAWQIVLANIDVIRRVLDPALPIDPAIRWVPASQRTDLGRVIYANSITLTPGTVSTDVESDRIQVHALTRSGLDELERGDMDARVRAVEG
ncbi:MAG: Na+/H+ antiporter subunit E [Alphaproteobacteria bacterium]